MTADFLADRRIAELLVVRATDGLTPELVGELSRRTRQYDNCGDDAIDRMAAPDSISGLVPQPLPESLRRRVAAGVDRWASGAILPASPTCRRRATKAPCGYMLG